MKYKTIATLTIVAFLAGYIVSKVTTPKYVQMACYPEVKRMCVAPSMPDFCPDSGYQPYGPCKVTK